jgi:colicin import membrane protein
MVEKPAAEEAQVKTRADYEAEWQAKLDKYAAEKRAWEDKIAAQKAAEERKQAAHATAQEAAARERAAHARLIEVYTKRQMDYEAERNRHTACVNGDKSACAALGKSASASSAGSKTGAQGKRSALIGFSGRTCEEALRGAEGPGSSIAGNTFEEVEREVTPTLCTVKGYVTIGHGAVTRQ